MMPAIGEGARAPVQPQTSPISSDQMDFIEETLTQFDANQLTQEQAQSIVEAFKESGIQPSRELASVMSNFGFDAKALGDLAGVAPPPPPASAPAELGSDQFSAMIDLLSELIDVALKDSDTSQLSEDQKHSIYEVMAEKFDLDTSQSIIHKKV